MGFEEVGEGFIFVDAHHDGVEGEAVRTRVDELKVALNALDSAVAQVVHERLWALVEASEQRSRGSH